MLRRANEFTISTRAHMKPEARSNDLSQIVALPYDLTVGQRGSPWDQR